MLTVTAVPLLAKVTVTEWLPEAPL
jgi:hypothetical protein